jgi:hypothetical protein
MKRRSSEVAPKPEATAADTLQRQDNCPPKPETFRFDHAYLVEGDEPNDGSSFWDVRVEADHMDMRVKCFTNRDDAEAYLQQLRLAGEIKT